MTFCIINCAFDCNLNLCLQCTPIVCYEYWDVYMECTYSITIVYISKFTIVTLCNLTFCVNLFTIYCFYIGSCWCPSKLDIACQSIKFVIPVAVEVCCCVLSYNLDTLDSIVLEVIMTHGYRSVCKVMISPVCEYHLDVLGLTASYAILERICSCTDDVYRAQELDVECIV